MPDLYLVWRGSTTDVSFAYGTRCSTSLPYFEPQVNLWSSGVSFEATGVSMAGLSDRLLILCNARDHGTILVDAVTGLYSAFCQSWPTWNVIGPNDGQLPASASLWPPALAAWGTGALAAWTGVGGDTRVWCSQYNSSENVWSSQFLTALSGTGRPIQSGTGPALVNFNGMLLMVWVGEGSNDGVYYATSRDGRTWTGNESIPGAGSSTQPALVMFNGAPVLCFKGIKGDGGIYSTTYHASSNSWAPVVRTGPFGTSAGPTLAVYQGKLFMAWKGDGNDTGLYWSITSDNLNPNAWTGQANISNVGSLDAPAAVVY